MHWRITYINIQSGKRESYMDIGFQDKASAEKEVTLLEKTQDHYEKIHFGRTRKDFKIEEIKLKKS